MVSAIPDLSTTYPVILGISTVLIGYVTIYAWRKRGNTGSLIYTLLLLDVFVWCAGLLLLPLPPTNSGILFLLYVVHTAVILIGPLWLLFVLEFSGRERFLQKKYVAGLLSPALVAGLFLWTNPLHGLYMDVEFVDAFYLVEPSYGPLFLAYLPYNWFVSIIGYVLLLRIALNLEYRGLYRRQSALLFLSALPAALGAFSYLVWDLKIDPTPIGFVFTGVVILFAILREDYLNIVPTARKTVLDEIENGVVVVNSEGKITDMNSAAKKMLGVNDPVGQHLNKVIADNSGFENAYRELNKVDTDDIEVEYGDGGSHYNVSLTPLWDDRGGVIGEVYVINDISQQKERERRLKERERELERQNERLDRFAGIVSHDLKNPLSIAEGYADMAENQLKEAGQYNDAESILEHVNEALEHMGEVRESQGRMNQIIDDALMIARQGKTASNTQRIELAEIVKEAWGNVDTLDASLEVYGNALVEADRNRLLNVFENLFRNSVEHGGPRVSVEVGITDEGFYVEDDGPGMPAEVRKRVTDHGYSTSDSTGFGLSIVKDIVTAHGWRLEVGESDGGGARIEVKGL